MVKITIEDVRKAREVIKDVIEKTPIIKGLSISKCNFYESFCRQ